MSPAIQDALQLFVLAALGAATFAIKRWIDENSKKTDAAHAAASEAKDAAERAQTEASAITRAQTDEYDVYVARRVIAALETLPECEPCRSEIAKIADRRRVWARRTSDPAPSKDPAR